MTEIIARNGNELTIRITIKLTGSLLEMENTLLDSCNEIGCLATREALQKFDTDGGPLKLGGTKITARVKTNKTYQTPYGSVQLERYVYQTPKGGVIRCPLEHNARHSKAQRHCCPTNIA